MKDVNHVFVLEPVVSDPRFRGFIWSRDAKSLLGFNLACKDFGVVDAESINWQPRSLQAVWRPQPVTGPVNAFNDYPCLEIAVPVFSRRAIEALGEMLTENGELLPLQTDVGEYSAFNVLTKIDALDLKKSKMRRTADNKSALDIEYFAFRKNRLQNASIFRVQEHPNIHLVTGQFKERAQSAALNGLDFTHVWPVPENTYWRLGRAARARESQKVKLAGQALIMRLRLRNEKPSGRENQLIREIKGSLAEKLSVQTLNERYWGSIETTEFADGEHRIFCTCPDCDELANYLSDWLEQVSWDHDLDIVKRYGNLYDKKAREKRISIRASSL